MNVPRYVPGTMHMELKTSNGSQSKKAFRLIRDPPNFYLLRMQSTTINFSLGRSPFLNSTLAVRADAGT